MTYLEELLEDETTILKCVPQHVYFIMDKRNILVFYVFIIAHY